MQTKGMDKNALPRRCVAIQRHVSRAAGELDFQEGDSILVLEELAGGWLRGQFKGQTGLFKKSYVKEEAYPAKKRSQTGKFAKTKVEHKPATAISTTLNYKRPKDEQEEREKERVEREREKKEEKEREKEREREKKEEKEREKEREREKKEEKDREKKEKKEEKEREKDREKEREREREKEKKEERDREREKDKSKEKEKKRTHSRRLSEGRERSRMHERDRLSPSKHFTDITTNNTTQTPQPLSPTAERTIATIRDELALWIYKTLADTKNSSVTTFNVVVSKGSTGAFTYEKNLSITLFETVEALKSARSNEATPQESGEKKNDATSPRNNITQLEVSITEPNASTGSGERVPLIGARRASEKKDEEPQPLSPKSQSHSQPRPPSPTQSQQPVEDNSTNSLAQEALKISTSLIKLPRTPRLRSISSPRDNGTVTQNSTAKKSRIEEWVKKKNIAGDSAQGEAKEDQEEDAALPSPTERQGRSSSFHFESMIPGEDSAQEHPLTGFQFIDEPRLFNRFVKNLINPETGFQLLERKNGLKNYKRCFVGSEAVDWLVDHLKLENRRDAVEIGNILITRGIIEHVNGQQQFLDKYIFYRFWFTK